MFTQQLALVVLKKRFLYQLLNYFFCTQTLTGGAELYTSTSFIRQKIMPINKTGPYRQKAINDTHENKNTLQLHLYPHLRVNISILNLDKRWHHCQYAMQQGQKINKSRDLRCIRSRSAALSWPSGSARPC